MLEKIKGWYDDVVTWDVFVPYIDGKVVQLSVFVPIIGYLLLVNDSVVEVLTFSKITETDVNHLNSDVSLDGVRRLQFVYFGLIFLGVSNLLYRWRKPDVFDLGKTSQDYVLNGLEYFPLQGFVLLYRSIVEASDYTTSENGAFESQWGAFERSFGSNSRMGFSEAKEKHGSVLRQVLIANFAKGKRQRRGALLFCILLSSVGYLFLFIPSLDVFLKILIAVF